MSNSERISSLVRDLYRTVADLELLAPGRRFTPGGHLVGTIGEVVAAELFGLQLMPASTRATTLSLPTAGRWSSKPPGAPQWPYKPTWRSLII